MDDVAATPAAPTSPAVTPTDAPKEITSAATVDPRQELEALLKKMGGLEVTAGGKKHKVDSVEKLVRYAQRGLPVESSLEELSQRRAEMEPMAQLLRQLQTGTEDEAESALEKLLDSGKLDKVAEKRLRRQYEREQQMEGLSPREREMKAELESERGARTKMEKERQDQEKTQAAAVEAQQVTAIKTHISGVITKTLESLGLGDKLEPIAVEFMKPIIRASMNAGRALDPELLAEKIQPMLEQLFELQTKNLDGEALLKKMGGDFGKKYRAALRAQLQGGGEKPKAPDEKPAATAPKWDPRRMF